MISTICLFLTTGLASADENLTVLPEKINGASPDNMLRNYLLEQADQKMQEWKDQYEQRTRPGQITEYQQRLRENFLKAIGELPPRTPLNPQITGTVKRNGYIIEKIILESQPGPWTSPITPLPV